MAAAAHQAVDESSLLADLRLGRPGSDQRLLAHLVNLGDRNSAFVRQGWSELCADAFRRAVWPAVGHLCERARDASAASIGRALAGVPRPSLVGDSATLPLDQIGRAEITIGDLTLSAVMDTGAEITVLMESVALAGGVRFLPGTPEVATTTRAVTPRLGVAPTMRIGEATVTNIPVIILPDEQLTFDEVGLRLPAILGLHAFLPFRRMEWSGHGTALKLGDAVSRVEGNGSPLFWHDSGFGVSIEGPRGFGPGHWDTGANRTTFFPAGIRLLSRSEARARRSRIFQRGGVGGITTEPGGILPHATFRLAGREIALANVDVAAGDQGEDAARLGIDILRRVESIIVDFDRMHMVVRP